MTDRLHTRDEERARVMKATWTHARHLPWHAITRGSDQRGVVRGSVTWLTIVCTVFLAGFGLQAPTGAAEGPAAPVDQIGTFVDFSTGSDVPIGLGAGPDGNMWVGLNIFGSGPYKIGRLTPDGVLAAYPIPSGNY